MIGALKGTPPDLSDNHDHYLQRKPVDLIFIDTSFLVALTGQLPGRVTVGLL